MGMIQDSELRHKVSEFGVNNLKGSFEWSWARGRVLKSGDREVKVVLRVVLGGSGGLKSGPEEERGGFSNGSTRVGGVLLVLLVGWTGSHGWS